MNIERKTVELPTGYGHLICGFEGELITRRISKHGIYDGPALEVALKILRKIDDSVVVDVGANIGNHALAFATTAGRVLSFEPIPEVFEVLRGNVARNSLENVSCFNLALSDHNGSQIFYVNTGGNLGASSFEERSLNDQAVATTVEMRIGDEHLAEHGLQRVDLIKIDVEGHEPAVLRGLAKTISHYQPMVMLEWNELSTTEQLKRDNIFEDLFKDYEVYVMGSNYDRACWEGHAFGALRRRAAKWFSRRSGQLYRFDSSRLYRNILLVPAGRLELLKSL